jgi:hypothetical protein
MRKPSLKVTLEVKAFAAMAYPLHIGVIKKVLLRNYQVAKGFGASK